MKQTFLHQLVSTVQPARACALRAATPFKPALLLFRKLTLTALVMFVAASVIPTQALAESPEQLEKESRILVIGGIVDHPGKLTDVLQPMADYMKIHLADLGVVDVLVVAVNDREHLAQLVRHGRVDWVSQSAYNSSYLVANAGMQMIARSWRDGSPTYKSVFFVRRESPIKNLSDLTGQLVAFEHPYSTSAYFAPKLEIEKMGRVTERRNSRQHSGLTESIGYTFSYSDYNTAVWVHKGIADIGTLSDRDWQNPEVVPLKFRKDFRVIHETEDFVRALELVRSDLDADIKEKLVSVLFNMHNDPLAENVLSGYYNSHRFDSLSDDDISRMDMFCQFTEQGNRGFKREEIAGATD